MSEKIPYSLPFLQNLIRYFLFAGIPFLIFYIWKPERFLKAKIQQRFAKRKDFIREILHSIQTTAVIGIIAIIIIYSPLSTYTLLYTDLSHHSLWWVPASALLVFIAHDTYFYWTHRIMHHPKLYKYTHLLHHKSTNPSPWTSYAFHITEAFVEAAFGFIILFILPLHPLSLLLFSIVAFAFNVYGHLGYEIAPAWLRHSWLFQIMNTSTHHNMHHEKPHGNYGLYFRFWDRIMHTEHSNYEARYDEIQRNKLSDVK